MNRLSELKENRKLDNKGFSLVELIIVIAIMAVLIGVLAPQYLKYVERSRQSADIDNVDQMISACEIYAADPIDGASFGGGADCTITCNAAGKVTAGGASGTKGTVGDALDKAGMDETALPDMRSAEYKDWTITFHANGIQFGGTKGGDLAKALGRNSVAP